MRSRSAETRRFLSCFLVFVLLSLAANTPTVRAEPAPFEEPSDRGETEPNHPGLLEKALKSGSVAVIVGLKLPAGFKPEGTLPPQAAESQRAAIATARRALLASLVGYGVKTSAVYQTVPYLALRVDATALKILGSSPLVAAIQEDAIERPLLASSTAHIGLPPVWASGVEGAGQAVVLIDQGIDTDHPFFGGRVIDAACFSNAGGTAGFTSLCPSGQGVQTGAGAAEADVNNPACWYNGNSLCSHGTWVAGIAAGGDSNTFDGVARRAGMIPIQVYTRFNNYAGCSGGGTCALAIISDQMSALEYIYTTLRHTYPIAAVSMSLGGGLYSSSCDSDSRKPIIDNLRSVGIATVISAGNNGNTNAVTAPACIDTAITAGGVSDTDTPPADAVVYNMHSLVDLLAPAQLVTSSAVGGGYGTASGTSISAPMVAGAFALCRSVNPGLTVDQIEAILEGTGIPVTDTRPGGLYTKPRLQMDAAIGACRHTNTWTGTHSAAWSDAANWSDGVVPASVTDVTIAAPPAGGRSPVLDVAAGVHSLTVQSGALLDLGSRTITVEGTVTNNGTLKQTKDVAPGTSRFLTLTDAAGLTGKYWGVDITTSNNLHATTVAISGNQFCPAVVDEAVRRCFDISPEVQQAASLTFYYRTAEANNNSMPTAWHWDGIAWSPLPGSQGGSGDALWVMIPSVNAYSPFMLHDAQPLAATLVSFTAEAEENQVLVSWETASEIDTLGFTIYRSDGADNELAVLAFVPSQSPGSTAGAAYTYADAGVAAGQTYWYWLESVDLAGVTRMHGPVQVTSR